MRWTALLAVGSALIAGCSQKAPPDDELNPVHSPVIPRIATGSEALDGAHIPTVDPATMNDAEITKVLGEHPFCVFKYTSSGDPALALHRGPTQSATTGVVKLNGFLIPLERSASADRIVLQSDQVKLVLPLEEGAERNTEDHREADLIFEVGQDLRVGYRGYYRCANDAR